MASCDVVAKNEIPRVAPMTFSGAESRICQRRSGLKGLDVYPWWMSIRRSGSMDAPASPILSAVSSQGQSWSLHKDVWPGQRNLSWLASISASSYKEAAAHSEDSFSRLLKSN